MFSHLITTCDSQIDSSFAHKGGNVGCGEENEGYRVVFHEGDIEAGFAPELDVGAGEEVEGCLLETSLWLQFSFGISWKRSGEAHS